MDTTKKLEQQLRTLKIYAIVLTFILALLIGFVAHEYLTKGKFKELTAERIDIVEHNGLLRMAISNKENQDPGSYGGKKIAKRDRPAGMIFFNDDGDECGGLVFDGNKNGAGMVYSVDQYKNDQIMQLQYNQEGQPGKNLVRKYGLKLWDRNDELPTEKLMAYVDSLSKLNDTAAYAAGIGKLKASGALGNERLFLGRDESGKTGLFIRDANGKQRLRIYIDREGHPVMETVDEKGKAAPVGAAVYDSR